MWHFWCSAQIQVPKNTLCLHKLLPIRTRSCWRLWGIWSQMLLATCPVDLYKEICCDYGWEQHQWDSSQCLVLYSHTERKSQTWVSCSMTVTSPLYFIAFSMWITFWKGCHENSSWIRLHAESSALIKCVKIAFYLCGMPSEFPNAEINGYNRLGQAI